MNKKYTAVVRSPKDIYGIELVGEFRIKGKPYWLDRMYEFVGKKLDLKLNDNGRYRCDKECLEFVPEWLTDIQEVVDWSKVPVDTKVEVSRDGINWKKRHFAEYKNGNYVCFDEGKTSWTTDTVGHWCICRLPEVES